MKDDETHSPEFRKLKAAYDSAEANLAAGTGTQEQVDTASQAITDLIFGLPAQAGAFVTDGDIVTIFSIAMGYGPAKWASVDYQFLP